MLLPNLSAADRVLFFTRLRQYYVLKVKIQLLDRNGNYVADVSDRFLDGQVNVDKNGDQATRSCHLDLTDVNNDLHLDSNSPLDGSLTRDRMVKVIWSAYMKLTAGYQWVDVPVFYGFITHLERPSTGVVSIDAYGKEWDFKEIDLRTANYKKDSNILATIKDIAADRGETKFDFPDWKDKLTDDFSIGRESLAWDCIKKLAKFTVPSQCYYDARGYLKISSISSSAVMYTFNTGTDGNIVTVPKIGYSDDMKNTIWVQGSSSKIESIKSLPASHPLSPQSLGRNGKPRPIVSKYSDDKIKSNKDADKVATKELAKVSLQSVTADFDAYPNPCLEFNDICLLQVNDGVKQYAFTFRLETFSIPLKAGTAMSVGSLKNLTQSKTTKNNIRG